MNPAVQRGMERARVLFNHFLCSWATVAVLEVKGSTFPLLGFISKSYVGVLKEPLQTEDGKFGVRIGREAIQFFILDRNLETEPGLKLIEITTIDNPQYADAVFSHPNILVRYPNRHKNNLPSFLTSTIIFAIAKICCVGRG